MSLLVKTLLKNVHGYGYSMDLDSEDVSRHSDDWDQATKNFTSNFKISRIVKVSQPYLEAAFLLRKHEYHVRGHIYSVKSLMHSTGTENVESILQSNLDWRRVYRQKYGCGVSFTDIAEYGHKHSRGYSSSQAMIIADVVIGISKTVSWSNPMDITFDTAISETQRVYVKFRDDEFFPRYVIYYSG
ncbi:zinc finger CCCH-type antiviral protein 1-like [Arctopsyche grandis]|uniref:zinc finger CCCH-type antiviral protein 1-like n=1 Tax=Arctopsyche grandis TaxID=121162 RepID=UPI00406D99BC